MNFKFSAALSPTVVFCCCYCDGLVAIGLIFFWGVGVGVGMCVCGGGLGGRVSVPFRGAVNQQQKTLHFLHIWH